MRRTPTRRHATLAIVGGTIILLAGCGREGPAAAGQAPTTLEKIARTRTITLGHRENSIPFSYFDNQQRVVGYAHDISIAIAREVAKELQLPELQINLVPVTSQTRIPLLVNNTIDLECGTMTNNTSRRRQIAFSINYFIAGTRFLVKKTSGIRDVEDLAGRNVVVSAGTTSEIALRRLNATRGLGIRVVAARDHGDAFVALEFGKVVAFMSDDAILFGEMSKAKNPGEWHVVGTPLTKEVYACGMRKADPSFKAIADRTIVTMMRAGTMRELYVRWFQSPIPPRGVNLGVPLDGALEALFAAPNDLPLQ
ncbi:MAG: transporter substrate-binding domain-containing protein [Steroidobacteraceae bacterium]